MMKQYIVEISEPALQDMSDIYEYIAETLCVPDIAMKQYDRIANAILSLDQFPERIKLMDAEPWHSMQMRKMPIDNYYVIFMVQNEKVIVTNVIYSASDFERKLTEAFDIGK